MNTIPARRLLSAAGIVALLAAILFVFAPMSSAAAECKPPGIPDYAGSGVNGAIDPKIEEPSGGNYYGLYSWGGLRWNTCDIQPFGSVAPDVLAELDTWAGNGLLGAGTGIAAIMTAMHKWSADPGALLKPIDDKIVQLSEISTEIFFGQWAFALIVFAAIGVLVAAITRNVRTTMMTLVSVLAACAFVAVVSSAPLTIAQSTDGVASSIVSAADAKALEYAGIPDSAPEGGGVYANTEESTGAILRDAMLQPMWRMGMTGVQSAADPTEAIFKASTASWEEVENGYKPEEKRDAYNEAVEAVKNDPAISNQYQTIKGQSYNRTGAGFLGAFMTLVVALIRVPAEALMFLGMLVIRFIPLIGPIFAALAIPEQTRPAATAALKIVAAAIFNVVVFGVIASVHTAITAILYVNAANLFVNTIISVLVTYLLLKLSKPYRSVTRLATGKAVATELERAPDGPGNAIKGVIGMATGTVMGNIVSGRGDSDRKTKRELKKDAALERIDRGHPGPDVVNKGWREAPAIHPGWSNAPGGSGAGLADGDGPFYQPERDTTMRFEDGLTTADLEAPHVTATMPDLLIEPEWDNGRLATNIFVPDAETNVVIPEHQVNIRAEEPVVTISDDGANYFRVEQ
ncbi:TrbL/VirB6 plasmid conjugal transfer protein [Microbacterium hydrocarbonoxydans]|uniref:TrbL/VirB6 plasmid conjugal transfer protein n=1 Tax=Microbacterium hydrocarbonoxydans TaxID=273678 RepID=A0A0M2HS80_9MICO|nr:type IV secretion system protein [Microbacterium hydrocarbonoxydans]KJL49556.1 TrbL/VirB6 plasmid conjugal transfer protein [Microbacterium hydrocarbonoxydans]